MSLKLPMDEKKKKEAEWNEKKSEDASEGEYNWLLFNGMKKKKKKQEYHLI